MSKDTAKKFAIGAVLAAVAGYVAGILTAPKSGKETRQDIKDKASETAAVAEKQLKQLHTQLDDVIREARSRAADLTGKAKDELNQAIDATKLAKEKAREILSAVHEGDAEDRDLQKAIKDASKAVDHLKTYLKKS